MPHFCAFIGSFFTLAAVILLIFAELSQVSPSQKVPRSLRLVTLDTTNFATGLRAAAGSSANLQGLFASGYRAGDGTGIRNYYEWGFWGFCEGSGTANDADYCTSTTWGYGFRPADVLLADTPGNQQTLVASTLPNSTFIASNYLGNYTTIAFYLVFVGAIFAGISMFASFIARRFAFILAALCSFVAFILVGVGAALWTIMIAKTRSSINGVTATDGTPLGLYVSYGNALWILWAAVAALLLSIVPLFIACCVGRGDSYDRHTYYGSEAKEAEYAPSYVGSQRPLSRAGTTRTNRTARTNRSSHYAGSQYGGGSIRY